MTINITQFYTKIKKYENINENNLYILIILSCYIVVIYKYLKVNDTLYNII